MKFLGRIDLLVRDESGRLVNVNHKTLSAYANVQLYLASCAISWHEAFYGLAVSKLFPDDEYRGSEINIIRKLKIPKKGVDDWNPFVKERVTVSKWQMEEFVRDAKAIISNYKKSDYIPRNTTNCTAYFAECPYMKLCRGMPDFGMYDEREPDYVDEARERYGDAWNVSRLMMLAACPRKYHLLYEENKAPTVSKPALDFGTAIHAALEAWYAPTKNGKPKLDDDEAKQVFVENLPEDHEQVCKDTETRDYGLTLLDRYCKLKRDEAKKIKEVIGTEIEVMVEI